MTDYNNLYNFKNTIRHFININSLIFPDDIETFSTNKLAWSAPFKYRVRKSSDSFRTLKIPNVLAFVAAYEKMKDLPFFDNPTKLDENHKRLSINVRAGEFSIGSFEDSLKKDFEKLCIYDRLMKIDIKEFYGRIYTHFLEMGDNERYLTNMNTGATNGLIMGNYLSLYWAEKHLSDISHDLETEFRENGIECEFSYFSDDFYFFFNDGSEREIIKIFDRVLENYDLERNKDKNECWDYFSYNNYNVVEKYWKKVILVCNQTRQRVFQKRLVFINQLIYRCSLLEDDKLRRILINGFFRTKYFRKDIDLSKYAFKDYDIHQLCFLFKLSPECLLYVADRFMEISNFEANKFKQFFEVRYKESLKKDFHEEQIYYFYAMKLWGLDEILKSQTKLVIHSKNQVLISYYLIEGWFDSEQIAGLKQQKSEELWFQNYHLIMYTQELFENLDNSIDEYLLPNFAKKDAQKNAYRDFYRNNLQAKKAMVISVDAVCEELHEYLDIRFEEAAR